MIAWIIITETGNTSLPQKESTNIMLKLDSAVKSGISLFSSFALLIQEVTHWETISQQVMTHDCTLESPIVPRQSWTEKITAAPRDGCFFLFLVEELRRAALFCCCGVGHVFCVMPGVFHIWQPTQKFPTEHLKIISHECTEMEKPLACVIVYIPKKVFRYHFSAADL